MNNGLPLNQSTLAGTSPGESSDRSQLWFLVGQTGPDEPVKTIPVASFPYTIGRHPGRSLCLAYPTISGKHAELTVENGQLVLTDLNSTNGTYVDGTRLTGSTPLVANSLVQFADLAFRVQEQQNASLANTQHEDVYDQALALVQFDRLMNERAVVPYFQPIVEIPSATLVGFEVLGRSRILGLESVQKMFAAATQLSLEVELSRMLRWEGLQSAMSIPDTPCLYVNTHPEELRREGLIQSMAALREAYPDQPITLEIHEAAISEQAQMKNIRDALLDIDIKLAFDDFGAGQARLIELSEVKPDILKFDMGLIRDIDQSTAERKQMLQMLVKISKDLGTVPLAEGIETQGEADFCTEIGFDLAQGFFYGRQPLQSSTKNNLSQDLADTSSDRLASLAQARLDSASPFLPSGRHDLLQISPGECRNLSSSFAARSSANRSRTAEYIQTSSRQT